jgi:hypothetical protein
MAMSGDHNDHMVASALHQIWLALHIDGVVWC